VIDAALGGERRTDEDKRLARAGAWLIGIGLSNLEKALGGNGK